MVPLLLGMVSYYYAIVTLSLRRAIFFQIFDFKNVVTLKSGSEVRKVTESGTLR